MSALGQKQTYAAQQAMSALPPSATAKADTGEAGRSNHHVMSALPPKADVRATSDVG